MKRNQPFDGGRADQNEDLAGEVHEAMRSLGWTLPQDEEDVRRAEAELAAHPAALPEELQDPQAAFERPSGVAATRPLPAFPGDADIDATLARAAREGGHLTPEIEEAMRRDREAAEREREDAQKDQ